MAVGEYAGFSDEQDDEEEEGAASDPGFYQVSSYGADYTVEVIVQRLKKGLIAVPKFQRDYVWTKKQASRFIESLLLGLPVPGIFLAQQSGAGEAVKHVIDGQQRLRTLEFFLDGKFRQQKDFKLCGGVCDKWHGRSYKDISEADQQRINESIIHAAVFRQDRPAQGRASMFHIYERLNTGGTKLAAQEIRACFMDLNDIIRLCNEVNEESAWRNLFSNRQIKGMKDQELILRFWAGCADWQNYKKPMKAFLNRFYESNASLTPARKEELRSDFLKVLAIVRSSIGDRAFRPAKSGIFNTAVFDAVMISLHEQVRKHGAEYYEDAAVISKIERGYDELLQDGEFRKFYEKTPNDREHYTGRIRMAIEKFGCLN